MAEQMCVRRLRKEFRALLEEPVPQILARPSPDDVLEWHYVLEGSKGTPFEGGVYHGTMKFPSDFPCRPPDIIMITPNGQFFTQRKMCLSIIENWNPMWSVSSILTGLLCFMMDHTPTLESLHLTSEEKQKLARLSLAYNAKNEVFGRIFPEYVDKYLKRQRAAQLEAENLQKQQDFPVELENPALGVDPLHKIEAAAETAVRVIAIVCAAILVLTICASRWGSPLAFTPPWQFR